MNVIDSYVVTSDTNIAEELCRIVSKCVTVMDMINMYLGSGRCDEETIEALNFYSLRLDLLKDMAFEDLSSVPEVSITVDEVLLELAKSIAGNQSLIGEPVTIMAIIGLATAVAGLAGVTAPFVAKYAPKIIEGGLETNDWLKKSYLKFLCLIDRGKPGKATSLATLIDKVTTILYGYNGSQTNGIRAIKSIGIDQAYKRALVLVEDKKMAKQIAAKNAEILGGPEMESEQAQLTETTQLPESTMEKTNSDAKNSMAVQTMPNTTDMLAPMSRMW